MEGHDPTAPALAVVRPDDDFIRTVRLASLGTLALGAGLVGVMAAGGPALPVGLLVFASLAVCASTRHKGNLTEVRVTTRGLDLVGHDGVVRTIDGPAIGGLGRSGAVVSGRLFTVPIGFVAGAGARLIVVDRAGRVICARRASWLRVDELEALATRAGVPWIGEAHRTVPGSSLAPPPEMGVMPVGSAQEDPATAAAIAQSRARTRRVVLLTWSLPLVATVAFLVLANGGTSIPAVGRGILGWVGGLATVAFLFGGPRVLVWSNASREVRRALCRGGPWMPVEGIVLRGGPGSLDGDHRMVGLVTPGTDQVTWYTVNHGGERGWLQGDDRTWFWASPVGTRAKALIAPPDRSHVGLLERRLVDRLVERGAASAVAREAEDWHHQQAWAAHQQQAPSGS